MKIYKCLFFILFISSSNVLYSQILAHNDIDIFINGHSRFIEMTYDNKLRNYMEQFENISEETTISIGGNNGVIDNDSFNAMQIWWQNILEIKAPKKLELLFNKMGWDNNGHKKTWTIIIGFLALFYSEEKEIDTTILINLFDKNDIEIIKERKDELMECLHEQL